MIDSHKIIGQSIDRVDGRDKVFGRVMFTADRWLAGMAHAVLVQSEIPHGVLRSDECEAVLKSASRAPGVLLILSPLNCPPLSELSKDLTDDLAELIENSI